MNIVYIAPMFHTNQVPIVRGWLSQGDQVTFISQYKGKTEDHQCLSPIVLGYSGLFYAIWYLHRKLHAKTLRLSAYPEAFRDRYGFPPIFRLSKIMKSKQPDIVILRERSLYSIFSYFVCRHHKIKCVLYNQTPLWDTEPPRNDLAHRIIKGLTPKIRITPVLGRPDTDFLDHDAVYIPFVIEPHLSPSDKEYFANDKINILCVGKYEERKHQLMLLELFSQLRKNYPLHLTLVGEASTPYHQIYLEKIKKYIVEHQLTADVDYYINQAPDSMPCFYKKADLFVLPSTGEFASVSQLEAMSYSLPVIVSDTNGTACYIEPDHNGYLFKDKDAYSLLQELIAIISSKQKLIQMGDVSYNLVETKYSFSNYKEAIKKLLSP